MARGRDRLKGKKVVVWQFANREFSNGNWLPISLDAESAPESGFYTPAPRQTRSVNGRIADVSRSPSPGSVPYRDSIVTLHLVEVRDERSGEPLGQAIVYAWGLRDNERMPLARVRKGDRISMRLMNWQDVESDYGGYRRTTLPQPELELEIPAWGEPVGY
jgi:alginate O-acetyltransferase complex protein AlgJ